MSLVGIVLVLYITYYGTKWLSVKANNVSNSKYMNIIDKIVLGQNKYLAIVEISHKYYLMSIAENGISIIKELDDIEITKDENMAFLTNNKEFGQIFSKIFKNDKK